MARINSNIAAMTARVNMQRANEDMEMRMQRLATGLRINRGADDPAGLIVSERLRSELSGIEQGIKNSERASNVIATTEGALNEVSELLNSINALVIEAANTGAFSKEETDANQLQIDSAIDSITRISNTATFAGLKLLNGEMGYITSGIDSADLQKTRINSMNFGDRANVPVDVDVVGSAQTAHLFWRTDYATPAYIGGAAVDDVLPSSVTVEIAGPNGVTELTFVSGASTASIVDAVNAQKSTTGVSASLVGGAGTAAGSLQFSSTGYGSDEFVTIRKLSGGNALEMGKIEDNAAYDTNIDWGAGVGDISQITGGAGTAIRDEGKDVEALVNGLLATGNGLSLSVRNRQLDIETQLSQTFAQVVGGTTQFHVTGGGSTFQLGPQVTTNQQSFVGIDSIAATRLGGTLVPPAGGGADELQFLNSLKTGGENSLRSERFLNASAILETAIDEVSTLRGRLGAFERNVLQTNINSLQTSMENITASSSVIRDADFALETSAMTRAQVLTQAGTSVLATANQNAQSVLSLLG